MIVIGLEINFSSFEVKRVKKRVFLEGFNVARDTEHIIKFGNDDRQDSGV